MGGDGAQEGPLGGLGGSSFRSEVSQTAQHGVIVPPAGEPGRGEQAAYLRVRGVRLVPPWPARCGPPRQAGTGAVSTSHRQRLDFTGGRGLGSRRSGARAGLGRHDRRGPAQARAQGEPGPRRRGRRNRSRRVRRHPGRRRRRGSAWPASSEVSVRRGPPRKTTTARTDGGAAMRYGTRYMTRYAMPSWYDDPALSRRWSR